MEGTLWDIPLTNNDVVYDVREVTNAEAQAIMDKLEGEGVIPKLAVEARDILALSCFWQKQRVHSKTELQQTIECTEHIVVVIFSHLPQSYKQLALNKRRR